MFKRNIKNKDIDFLSAYLASDKKTFMPKQYYKYIIPPICLVLIFGGGFAFLKIQENGTQEKVDAIKEEIAAFDKDKKDNHTDEKYKQLETNQKQLSALKDNAKKMNSYPQLSYEVVSTILKTVGTLELKTMNYNQENGELKLVVETKRVAQTNEFARALRNTELFEDLKYSGYFENKETNTITSIDPNTGQLQENTETTNLTYTLTVACILREGA